MIPVFSHSEVTQLCQNHILSRSPSPQATLVTSVINKQNTKQMWKKTPKTTINHLNTSEKTRVRHNSFCSTLQQWAIQTASPAPLITRMVEPPRAPRSCGRLVPLGSGTWSNGWV
jgi:hypothetical protein